jgi:hypothetical protein
MSCLFSCCELCFHAPGNTVGYVIVNGFLGDTDGITESKLISAAMTLDDDAIEAEKTGAVVAARVDSAGK